MTSKRFISFLLFLLASASGLAIAQDIEEPAAEPLVAESVYHLANSWTTHNGEEFVLSELRGHSVVALMFYGTCQHVCSILIHDVQQIDAGLSEEVSANTRFLLITIDPDRDTPEALATLAEEKGMDARFVLLNGNDTATRGIAALLGVQYRETGSGHFSHSNVITLLNAEGVVTEQIEGLRQDPAPIVDILNE